MRPTTAEIIKAVDEAAELTHPYRAMLVTMECGHLRLTPHVNTTMGVGVYTACRVCPITGPEQCVMRQVMKVEETGTIHDDWLKMKTKERA